MSIRQVILQGVEFFSGKDVASLMGYTNLSSTLAKIPNGLKIKLSHREITSMGLVGFGTKGGVFINKKGIYFLVASSRLPTEVIDKVMLKFSDFYRDKEIIRVWDENAAISTIEQTCGNSLLRQYPCGKYKIDAYDKLNKVAYEIDESKHRYQQEADAERQAYIEGQLGCTFVRIKL